MRGPTQKKHYSNAPIVIRHSLKHATWRNMREPTPEAFSMPRVCQQLLLNSWPLEGTYGNPLRRDSIQVHKVWQQLLTNKLLGDTGEKPFKCTKWDKSFTISSYLKTNEATQERSHSSAQKVTSVFQDQVPWRSMRGLKQERSLSNARSVTRASWNKTTKWNLRGPIQERSHSNPPSAWRHSHKQATWRKMTEPTQKRSLSNV